MSPCCSAVLSVGLSADLCGAMKFGDNVHDANGMKTVDFGDPMAFPLETPAGPRGESATTCPFSFCRGSRQTQFQFASSPIYFISSCCDLKMSG